MLTASARTYAPRMRDIEVIDGGLRLLLAIRHMVRRAEGRPPSTERIDELLDERSANRGTECTLKPVGTAAYLSEKGGTARGEQPRRASP